MDRLYNVCSWNSVKSKKSSSDKDKKKDSSKDKKSIETRISLVEKLLGAKLHDLKQEQEQPSNAIGHEEHKDIPSNFLVSSWTLSNKNPSNDDDDDDDDEENTTVSCLAISVHRGISTVISSTVTVGTTEFYNDVASKLRPPNAILFVSKEDQIVSNPKMTNQR